MWARRKLQGGKQPGKITVFLLVSALFTACGTLNDGRGDGQDAWGPVAPGEAGVPGIVRSTMGLVTGVDTTQGRLTLEGGATYLLPPGPQQLPGGLFWPPRVGETVRLTYIEYGPQNVIRSLEVETPQNSM